MTLEIVETPEVMAARAVDVIVQAAQEAIDQRGQFSLAISGGSTPKRMLSLLGTREDLEWSRVHLLQVDERVAPAGHADRNAVMQQAALFTDAFTAKHQLAGVWWMPVDQVDAEQEDAIKTACRDYESTLAKVCGDPIVIDLVQLGLGDDGHTASLVPDDAVCEVSDTDIAATGWYHGRRRLTMTYSLIHRARQLLWTVAGANKQDALKKWLAKDPSIPGGKVLQDNAIMIADRAAAEVGT